MLSEKTGEGVTAHGQRDIDDDRLSNLIEAIITSRLWLDDFEADLSSKSHEHLIRKFTEGCGQSAGAFYIPPKCGTIISQFFSPELLKEVLHLMPLLVGLLIIGDRSIALPA